MRPMGLAAWSLGLALLAGSVGAIAPVGTTVARQATPVATPAPVVPTPPPAEPAAEPAATPAPPAAEAAPQTDVVTLATWYATDPSGEFINVYPLAVDDAFGVGPEAGTAPVGRAEFPEEGVPTIQLGDTNFDSYARTEGDIPERWTWLDDVEGARPATLVLQVAGLDGAYQGYFGTATFISRDEGGAGGVLVFALRPPTPAAEPAAPAEGATEGDAEGEAAADDAAQPLPEIEPPTEVLTEPEA